MNVFLTGTDTGVGKTYVAVRMVRALRAAGVDAVGFKPLCCGDRGDAEALHSASGACLSLHEVNPVWLRVPAAPYVAAMVEERAIDLSLIHDTYKTLAGRHETVIVEGVGGWLVPITREFFVADLAAMLGLPVMLVAANRLGALNHNLLTLESIRARGLRCAGFILNRLGPIPPDEAAAVQTNAGILESLLSEPFLGEVAPEQGHLPDSVIAAVRGS